MSSIMVLFGILGALLIGAISPGPSFVLVSRVAITASRFDGLAAAFGMGLGGAIFGTLALLGLSALLIQVDWLYLTLKLIGGTYLIYIGVHIWLGASRPLIIQDTRVSKTTSPFRSFYIALITQISNPKTAVVYGSIFAALLPASPPIWMLVILPLLIFIVETSWYTIVALVFSSNHPRTIYLELKVWIDRAAGAIMGGLGLKLLVGGMLASVETGN